MGTKTFTKEELAQYNGQNGQPSYVALDGVVYDVSDSPLWEDGEHQFQHNAGQDLSEDILMAPHLEDLVQEFPVVGKLAD